MIKNESYCNELKNTISKDEEYRDSIEHLYEVFGTRGIAESVLPEINAHIEKLSKEVMSCTPFEFEGNLKKFVKEYLSRINNEKPVYPPSVCFKFIENQNFNANFDGKLYQFVKKYLDGKGIRYTCEKDTQDDDKNHSFIKFGFVRNLQDGPSSVTILCSESSNEIYVFTDCFLNYPINRDEVNKYGGVCIKVNLDNNNSINESSLRDSLNNLLKRNENEDEKSIQYEHEDVKNEKNEVENEKEKKEKAEEEFRRRFSQYGDFDSRELVPFVFFYLLTNRNEELLNDFISNFGPLIDGYTLFSIPKFRDQEGIFLVTCNQHVMSETSDGQQREFNNGYEEIVKEFNSYKEIVSGYENAPNKESYIKEVDGRTFKIELDTIPLYLVPLYFYSYMDVDTFSNRDEYISFTDKISNELIRNVDVNRNSDIHTKIFVNLLGNAVYGGIPEILHFAEEHHIGFHSKKDFDTNMLVSFCIRTIERFTTGRMSVEDYSENAANQKVVLDFILEKCGQDIFEQMSKNSRVVIGKDGKKGKPSAKFFSDKICEWRENFEKSNKKLNLDGFNRGKNEYKDNMIEILGEIIECFSKKYYRELRELRNNISRYNLL